MSQHLSPDQISRWIAGACAPDEERHGRECPHCRAEIARLESVLTHFRGSVRSWSDGQSSAALAGGWKSARPRSWRWALVAATALLVAAIPIYRRAESARADALLLEQVDAGVARAVPRPMEPLIQLLSWDANPTAGNERKR